MPARLFVTGVVLTATATLGAIRLTWWPAWMPGEARVVAVLSLSVVALVLLTGLLLVRSRWARFGSGALAVAAVAHSIAGPFDASAISEAVLGGLLAAALMQPRLGLRLRPSASGPPPIAVAAVLGLLALPLVVAVAGVEALRIASWVLVAASIIAAVVISRASLVGLWGARVILPALVIWAAVTMEGGGWPVVLLFGLVTVGALWSPAVARSVDPLTPERSPAVPTPPELVDAGLLESAGYDDRGRPLETP